MRKYILIFICLFLQAKSHAQKKGQARTDSLLQVIKTATQDTSRILALNTLATDYLRSKTDSAILLANEAIQLARKIKNTRKEADSYFTLGQIYTNSNKVDIVQARKNFEIALILFESLNKPQWVAETCYLLGRSYERNNYDMALQYFRKGLSAAQQSGIKNLMGKVAYIIAVIVMRKGDYNEAQQHTDLALKYYTEAGNETGVANCYIASSRIQSHRGNYEQAVRDNYNALRIYEKLGYKVGIYNVHIGLGNMYENQKNYNEALKNYLAAKKAAEELGVNEVLGAAYANMGNAYRELGKNEEALQAYAESTRLAELAQDKKGVATALGNIGTIYSRTGRLAEALKSFEQAKKMFEEIGNNESVAVSYIETGGVLLEMKKPAESRQSLVKALDIALKYGYKELITQSYLALSKVDTTSGDYISALANYKLYINYRDSISNAAVTQQLLEQKLQYAFSKKEDSLRLEQALIAEQLEKQTLLTKQQEQALKLKQASLDLAEREKDVQMLRFLKTKADLQLSNEQQEKQLALAEQEKAIQQSRLDKQTLLSSQKEQQLLVQDKQLTAQRTQRNFLLAGAIALILLSFFIYVNNRNQRKANARLREQQAKTEKALADLKAAQAQLIQSEKMASLGELTAGIAHEIQNPLNFVNNFSELNNEMLDEMKEELEGGNFDEAIAIAMNVKENNEKIHFHGKRADGIVKGMLQHSRATGNKKEPIDINKLADEYMRLSYHGLRAKDKNFNANFISEFDESIEKMDVVPQDMGRVLLNLLNNAFYAVNERKKLGEQEFKPTVSVTTKKVGNTVEISVKDNGTGIPQQALEKIYQPFFTTKPTGQGTGLGLSLSYDIIKAHGGEMNVNTKEGEYAEFIIRLPVSNQQAN